MTSGKKQDNEIGNLQSIYGKEFHAIAYLNFTGHFALTPKVPRGLKLLVHHKGNTSNRRTIKETITVQGLPPFYLYFTLPSNYPEKACPRFVLDCVWLPDKYLKKIARNLIQLYNDTKDSILQKWAEYIDEKLRVLFEQDIITLYEYRDERGGYNLSFNEGTILERRAVNNMLGHYAADSEDSDREDYYLPLKRRKKRRQLVESVYQTMANRTAGTEVELSYSGTSYPVQLALATIRNSNTENMGPISEPATATLERRPTNLPEPEDGYGVGCSSCLSFPPNTGNRATIRQMRGTVNRHAELGTNGVVFTDEARKKMVEQLLTMNLESAWDSVLNKDREDSVVCRIEPFEIEHEYLCGVCLDDVPRNKCTTIFCGHTFCNECLINFLTFKMTEKDLLGTSCPKLGCGFKIAPSVVSKFLDTEMYERYKVAYQVELEESKSELPLCLRFPDCGGRGAKMSIGKHSYKCQECSFEFCKKCEKEYHGVTNCTSESERRSEILKRYDEGTEEEKEELEKRYKKETLDVWRQNYNSEKFIGKKYKPCPKCYRMIEKYRGCDQMYCPKCRTHFCYKCLSVRFNQTQYTLGRVLDEDYFPEAMNDCGYRRNPERTPMFPEAEIDCLFPMRDYIPDIHTLRLQHARDTTNFRGVVNRTEVNYNITIDVDDGKLGIMRKNLERAKEARRRKIKDQLKRTQMCRNNFWKQYEKVFETEKEENLTGRLENVPIRITSKE